ncbi:uncharacterized protein LOC114298109 isoform X1 [Camellia sinensis]|uniref:uncharacterized protein LOC114298109 isoform X1 n=2 Tax=Camellia sinensis TaxID=4442 RepID=UPI001035B39A|nr:uncharacterized protein LOC114298109 isoform X1 [Camellia sinensis]
MLGSFYNIFHGELNYIWLCIFKTAMEASTSSEVKFQILANSHIPLSISSGDEVESAISRFTSLGKLQSVKGMTIQKAFGLDGAEPIQNVVKAVATDEEMRNVFLNITEVQEFKRQLMTSSQVHIFINEI